MDAKINPFCNNLITIEPARSSRALQNNGGARAYHMVHRAVSVADRAWVHRSRLSLTTPPSSLLSFHSNPRTLCAWFMRVINSFVRLSTLTADRIVRPSIASLRNRDNLHAFQKKTHLINKDWWSGLIYFIIEFRSFIDNINTSMVGTTYGDSYLCILYKAPTN